MSIVAAVMLMAVLTVDAADVGAQDPVRQRYVVMSTAIEPTTPNGLLQASVALGSAEVGQVVESVTGVEPVRELEPLSAVVVDLDASAAAALSVDSRLVVEPDTEVSSMDRGDDVPWGVDRLDQPTPELDGRFAARFDGSGATIFVVDSGVSAGHDQLAGRVVDGFDLFDDDSNGTNDCYGHGTHVASVAAGRTVGVAPGATIVPVRVLDCAGRGHTSGVAEALGWIIESHDAPGVINLSLGGAESEVLDAAIARAHDEGFVVVVAAGNSAADACEASPSRAPEAITVGGVGRNDVYASWSNFGPCVDVSAPGAGIVGANAKSATGLRNMSGTSQASPHVAGMAAMMIEAGVVDPDDLASLIVSAAGSGVEREATAGARSSESVNVAVLPEQLVHHVTSVEASVTGGADEVVVVSVHTDAPVVVTLSDSGGPGQGEVLRQLAAPSAGIAYAIFEAAPGTYEVGVEGFDLVDHVTVVAAGAAVVATFDAGRLGFAGFTFVITASDDETVPGPLGFGPTGLAVELTHLGDAVIGLGR